MMIEIAIKLAVILALSSMIPETDNTQGRVIFIDDNGRLVNCLIESDI
jgi:hypothetical protein